MSFRVPAFGAFVLVAIATSLFFALRILPWDGRDNLGSRAALTVDRSVSEKQEGMSCSDRSGVLPNGGRTLLDLVGPSGWKDRDRPAPQDVQAVRKRRYFIAALLRGIEDSFGSFQRELVKTIYILGNSDLSNIFVSIYETDSAGLAHLQLLGFESLLKSLKVPHRVILGHEDEAASAGQGQGKGSGPSGSTEAVARLRNAALKPLLEGDTSVAAAADEYDGVLYLDGLFFCASDAVDLLRVVTMAGKSADLSCGLDFVAGRSGGPVLRDVGAARDARGMNMLREAPHVCHLDTASEGPDVPQDAASVTSAPFSAFSCWNGMAAADADLFTSLGLRFRAPRRHECQQSERELFARDMRALGRGSVVVVPSVRVAADWATFKQVQREVSHLEEGNGQLLPPESVLPALAAVEQPSRVSCCGLGSLQKAESEAAAAMSADATALRDCAMEPDWQLVYAAFGVPVAETRATTDIDVAALPEQQLTAAGAVAAVQALAATRAEGELQRHALLIPRRVVQWSGASDVWAGELDTLATLSAMSFASVNPGYEVVAVSDEELLAWAAPGGAGADAAASWLSGVEHALTRSQVLHLGFLRLIYAFEHGGVFVPPVSWAGAPFEAVLRPSEELVAGLSSAGNAINPQEQLFLATAAHGTAMEAVLREARERLASPEATYQRLWSSLDEAKCEDCSPAAAENRYFTGAQLLADVLSTLGAPDVRVAVFDATEASYGFGSPEHLCSQLKARSQIGGDKGVSVATSKADALPVYAEQGATWALFSGLLRGKPLPGEPPAATALNALRVGHRMLPGQYILAVPKDPVGLDPAGDTLPLSGCSHPRRGDGGGGGGAGHCFLWLSLEGSLGIYYGLGPIDPNMAIVETLSEAPPPASGSRGSTQRWLMLQYDGNLVLYQARSSAAGSLSAATPAWRTAWSFPAGCSPGTVCNDQGYLALHEDGSLALHRGITPAMRAYLEVGMPAVLRVRNCLYRSKQPPRPNSTVEQQAVNGSNSEGKGEAPCTLPQILTLATFPNSGTSFTLEATLEATRAPIYTRYDLEASGAHANTSELQDVCGQNACYDLGICQIGRNTFASQHLTPPGHGSLFKTHVTWYGAGVYKPVGLRPFLNNIVEGNNRKIVQSYGFLRLFRNPFDNMVARFHFLYRGGRAVADGEKLTYDKAGFLSDDAIYPKRDLYTYLYWHLSFNLAAEQLGLPAALLTYENIYLDPVGYLRRVMELLGYSEEEVSTARLSEVSRNIIPRDAGYHRGELLPVYLDHFYDAELIREMATIIDEILAATDCLSKPEYPEPRYGPIPFVQALNGRRRRQRRRRQRRRRLRLAET